MRLNTRLLASVFVATLPLLVACGEGPASRTTTSNRGHDEPVAAHENLDGDEHSGEEHGDEGVVRLSSEELEEFEVEVATAAPGSLEVKVSLPGEVVVNADRLAHLVPRVGGVVREVRKSLGDAVREGEVVAVIESRELADAKAAYLAANERLGLADATFQREERLWRDKISSEQDYLDARNGLAEARINFRAAEQKLHALGFAEDELRRLTEEHDADYTRYRLVAPFAGTVIEKHITLGEAVEANTGVFMVADLASVWVDLSVYQKDLPHVREGQRVTIFARGGALDTVGVISYVGAIVGEETRTALARVVLPNPDGRWRPGLFVTASITVDEIEVPLAVPKTAVLTMDDRPVVFVEEEGGYAPRPVVTGATDGRLVEIVSGLAVGDVYVAAGGFTLKAELEKETFGEGHGH